MEKLVMELMSLGLTSPEAHIYICFSHNNIEKKKETLSQLGIGEQQLEDSLRQLTKKGFMETKDSKIFSVVPLQLVMERLIKDRLKEVKEIRGEIENYKLT